MPVLLEFTCAATFETHDIPDEFSLITRDNRNILPENQQLYTPCIKEPSSFWEFFSYQMFSGRTIRERANFMRNTPKFINSSINGTYFGKSNNHRLILFTLELPNYPQNTFATFLLASISSFQLSEFENLVEINGSLFILLYDCSNGKLLDLNGSEFGEMFQFYSSSAQGIVSSPLYQTYLNLSGFVSVHKEALSNLFSRRCRKIFLGHDQDCDIHLGDIKDQNEKSRADIGVYEGCNAQIHRYHLLPLNEVDKFIYFCFTHLDDIFCKESELVWSVLSLCDNHQSLPNRVSSFLIGNNNQLRDEESKYERFSVIIKSLYWCTNSGRDILISLSNQTSFRFWHPILSTGILEFLNLTAIKSTQELSTLSFEHSELVNAHNTKSYLRILDKMIDFLVEISKHLEIDLFEFYIPGEGTPLECRTRTDFLKLTLSLTNLIHSSSPHITVLLELLNKVP